MNARSAREVSLTRPASGSLASSVVHGTAWTVGSQWVRLAVNFGSTLVLARLLSPEDFGLIGMVSAIVGIAHLILTLGLSQATVQRDTLTHEQVNFLFWVNAALGVVLAGSVAAISGLIAGFYGRPELQLITLAMTLSFLFGGASVQHQALLNRQMRFGALASIEVISLVVGVGTGIIFAAAGFGYWSLVWMAVTDYLSRALLSWHFCRWRPSWPKKAEGVGGLLRFGANLSIFSFVNYLSRNADNVLIGRRWGADSVGIYSKAYSLLLMPLNQVIAPLTRVALPVLSTLQKDPVRFRKYYRSAMAMIAVSAVPLMGLMAVMAEEVVAILLGSQWSEATPIFQVLAISGIAQVVASPNGWLYIATNRTGDQALWALVSRPLIILSFFLGLPWGPLGVAVSYTLMGYLLLVPGFWLALRNTPVGARELVSAVWRPFLATGVAAAAAAGARLAMLDSSLWLRAAVASGLGVAAYAGVLSLFPKGRADVRAILSTVRKAAKA